MCALTLSLNGNSNKDQYGDHAIQKRRHGLISNKVGRMITKRGAIDKSPKFKLQYR